MASHEGRAPPAYQEYAADMLASRLFRLMTLTQRGLLHTMKLELWVNETLPADPGALAKILGLDAGEVVAALPTVMPFFAAENYELRCPELDRYRAHLNARHLAQSEGGKRAVATLNAKRKKRSKPKIGSDRGFPSDAGTPSATLSGTPPALERLLSTGKQSKAKSNPPLEKSHSPNLWIKDYTDAEVQRVDCTADAYRRASRG